MDTSSTPSETAVTFDTSSDDDPDLSVIQEDDTERDASQPPYNLRDRKTLRQPDKYDDEMVDVLQNSMKNTVNWLFSCVRDQLLS